MTASITDTRITPSMMRTFFGVLPEGIVVWGADKRLVYANEAARTITELPLPEGSVLADAPYTSRVLDHDTRARDPRSMPVYRAFQGERVPREDLRYITPSGAHRWLSVAADPVRDENGALSYVIVSLRDISVRKSRESKLEFMVESAKILQFDLPFKQRLVEKAKLAVPDLADWCVIDVIEDDSLVRAAIIHRDTDQIARLAEFEAQNPSTLGRERSVERVIRTREPLFIPVVTEEHLRSHAESQGHHAAIASFGIRSIMIIPIISHGKAVGAMTLAYAESGRTYTNDDLEFFQEFCYHLAVIFENARLFDEIAMRDKSKDIFLAALSHELRNPLAPIKSALELLKMRELSADVQEDLDIIEHQFDHMARLLHDLLDVTRFTQDRIALTTSPVDLRSLVERALRSTDALVRKAGITLQCSYPLGDVSVLADETRLEQAISNLISNAVKFTPARGSIWVDMSAAETDTTITVRDNGAGIDASDLPHIFDLYYQGKHADAINSGLGIGLLLVQRIVTLHGGTVRAHSDGRGRGSSFTITLPRSDVRVKHPGNINNRCLATGMRILVVDDNAPAADALVRLLKKLGSDARAAYSGHDALGTELLSEIDLFLLDVGMPDMDGYELVRALRTRGISAPIVALTGYGLADDKQRASEAGFTAHLTKPIGLAELNGMFDAVLARA